MPPISVEDKSSIRDLVTDILEIDPDRLTDSSRFKEDHDADSLRAIEILAALERMLGVEIDQSELARMVNLDGIYAVVDEARRG